MKPLSLKRLIGALLIFTPIFAAAETNIPLLEPGAWVEPLVPLIERAPLSPNGFHYDLMDIQVNVETEESYIHFVYTMQSVEAVQSGATIQIDYDPSYSSVTLHYLRKLRDGKVDDQTDADFRPLRREQGLEASVYDGMASWVSFVKNVQVGDSIEFAYTVKGRNPIFNGKYADNYTFQGWTPVADVRFRLLYPASRLIRYSGITENDATSLIIDGAVAELRVSRKDLAAIRYLPDMPDGYQAAWGLELSEFQSWAELSEWGSSLYAAEPDHLTLRKAEELTAKAASWEERVLALLEFVQDSIRYLGIETGVYSHQPRLPAQILSNLYGDCKDKAVLFCALAKAIGIDACPVLVSDWRQELLAESIVSPLVFNHVIAMIKKDGKLYFVDPTRSLQGGGLAERHIDDYRWGLALDGKADSLIRLPEPPIWKVELTERIFMDDYSGKANVSALFVYRGGAADQMRAYLLKTPTADLTKEYGEYCLSQYDSGSIISDARTIDNRALNEIGLEVKLALEELWHSDDDKEYFFVRPYFVSSMFEPPDSQSRDQPLGLIHPAVFAHKQVIQFPDERYEDNEDDTVKTAAFLLKKSRVTEGRLVTIDWLYQSLADRVEAERWPDYLDELKLASSNAAQIFIREDDKIVNEKPDYSIIIGSVAISLALFLISAFSLGRDY